MSGGRYLEDPSISRCAALEFDRLMGIIEAGSIRSGSFHVAREKVLAHEIPAISRVYGPVVAEGVAKKLQWHPPHKVSQRVKDDQAARMAEIDRWVYGLWIEREKRLNGGALRWYDRLWVRLYGYPISAMFRASYL